MKIFTEDNKHRTLIAVSFLAGLILTAAAYETGMWFRDNYKFQNPFVPLIVPLEISPIVEEQKVISIPSTTPTPEVSPKKTSKMSKGDIVTRSLYPDFVQHIWLRESGRGSNAAGLAGYCAKKGMSNEFGFAVSVKHCFADFETSVRRLERWYEDNSALTDNQKLCRYNSGTASDSCAYLTLSFKDMN